VTGHTVQTPATATLAQRLWLKLRQHAVVDWLFLRTALGIAIGLLPFWAFHFGTVGSFIAGIWTVCYALLVAPGIVLCAMLGIDAALVARNRSPRFWPTFQFIAEQPGLHEKLERMTPPAIRAYGQLSASLGFWISPFGLVSVLLSAYVVMSKPPAAGQPPIEEAQIRTIEARAYMVIRERERRIEEMEINRTDGVLV
jgi:hypothetical protein